MVFDPSKCVDGRKVKGAYTTKQVKDFAKFAGVKLSEKGKAKSKIELCKEVGRASAKKNASEKPYGLGAYPEKFRASVAAKMKASGRPLSHYSKTTGKLKKQFQYVYKMTPAMR